MEIERRVARLRALMAEKVLDGVLVTKEESVHYFSGFRGDSTALLITPERLLLMTDNRYTEQAQLQAKSYDVVEQHEGLSKKIAEAAQDIGILALGFEGGALTCDRYEQLKSMLGEISFDTSLSLDALRMVKDADEIAAIRRACAIADAAFAHIITVIRPGMTECEVAAEMEYFMRREGSERPAFTTIVASGVRGSLPHGVASTKEIARGELVTMDFGAVYEGYCSDITRTICVGRADAHQRERYDAVLAAQERALAALHPGVTGIEADRVARDALAEKNLAQYFGHGLGHSLGLEIHEEPRLSKSCPVALQENMLITDEPGIYIPGWGGIRIEDTVLITHDGAEPLTHAPKEFIEICI